MSTLTSIYSFIKHLRGDTPWDVEVNANYDSIDAELARPRQPFNSPVVGATTTCDLSLARIFVFTVSQATTLAFTNVPSSSFGVRVVLRITNGSAFVLTLPASMVPLSGVAPIFKSSGVDLVEMLTIDGGTTWYYGLLDRPLNRLIGQAVADVGTGAATIETTLHTVAVPANILGPNGALRIRVHFTVTGGAAAKQIAVYYGAFQIGLSAQAAGETVTNGIMEVMMVNRNATNAQHYAFYVTDTDTTVNFNGGTATADSTAALNITVKGTTPNAADEVTAHVTLVELLRA